MAGTVFSFPQTLSYICECVCLICCSVVFCCNSDRDQLLGAIESPKSSQTNRVLLRG